jgi:hypothetical protein
MEMAEALARRVVIFCVDHRLHAAYAQGLRESADSQLARERVRQGRTDGNLVVIVLCLTEWTQSSTSWRMNWATSPSATATRTRRRH